MVQAFLVYANLVEFNHPRVVDHVCELESVQPGVHLAQVTVHGVQDADQ